MVGGALLPPWSVSVPVVCESGLHGLVRADPGELLPSSALSDIMLPA